MENLSWILLWFEATIGLNINMGKNSVMAVGCTGTLPTTYLSLPLGMCHNSISLWDGVEERFRNKTSHMEKMLYLQRGKTNSLKGYSF